MMSKGEVSVKCEAAHFPHDHCVFVHLNLQFRETLILSFIFAVLLYKFSLPLVPDFTIYCFPRFVIFQWLMSINDFI